MSYSMSTANMLESWSSLSIKDTDNTSIEVCIVISCICTIGYDKEIQTDFCIIKQRKLQTD